MTGLLVYKIEKQRAFKPHIKKMGVLVGNFEKNS